MRIKIHADGSVVVSAPTRISNKEIEKFVEERRDRIEEKQKIFKRRKNELSVKENELLLHGEVYAFQRNAKLGTKTDIDHAQKIITSGLALNEKTYQEKRYKTYAKTYLAARLQEIAELHELSYNKMIIRNAKTNRWTCSSKKNIWLNRRLVKMPEHISDYIICHELAHLLEMNHSPSFRAVVDTLYGNKKAAIGWVKKYGLSLH